MGEVIVVGKQVFQAAQCRFCGVKIYPDDLRDAHEATHKDTGWRICNSGHNYQAKDLGEWKTCPYCRREKSIRSQRRTGNRGGRPKVHLLGSNRHSAK